MECKFGTESTLKVKSSRNANLELSSLLKVEILKRNVQYPTYFNSPILYIHPWMINTDF
jgi:hypothetical protein